MDRELKPHVEPGRRTDALGVVSEAPPRLGYGAIQLTVHDGKVMQVDVTSGTAF